MGTGSQSKTTTMTVADHEDSILEVLSMLDLGTRASMRSNIKAALKDANTEMSHDLPPEAKTIMAKQIVYAGQALDLLERIEQEVKDLDKVVTTSVEPDQGESVLGFNPRGDNDG